MPGMSARGLWQCIAGGDELCVASRDGEQRQLRRHAVDADCQRGENAPGDAVDVEAGGTVYAIHAGATH